MLTMMLLNNILILCLSWSHLIDGFQTFPRHQQQHQHQQRQVLAVGKQEPKQKEAQHPLQLLVGQEGLRRGRSLFGANDNENDVAESTSTTPTLALLTFDLDDTLYPIEPVIAEANTAFATAMIRYGFEGIEPNDIVEACKEIRTAIAKEEGPEASAILTHTEIRSRAIRREMEKVIFNRKLKETADDWATPVSSLSPIIVNHAKKWSKEAVSSSVVQAVMNAWEMERHHAAERHLYSECMDVFAKIRKQYPNVIIGAVTDGKANPLFMTFTLAKYFDFCLSWEDDQGGRSNFFKELSSVQGNAELKWIYNAALEKYSELSAANAVLKSNANGNKKNDTNGKLLQDHEIWIHVGDDLAYDVGGAAQCGAKTILAQLEENKYKQTARFRFDAIEEDDNDHDVDQPLWSTTTIAELKKRKTMNAAAEQQVDKSIQFLTRLPEAINDILEEQKAKLEEQALQGQP